MTDKLKPCPFCGSESLDIEEEDRSGGVFVFCEDCNARTGFEFYEVMFFDHPAERAAIDAAIKAWNRRAEDK